MVKFWAMETFSNPYFNHDKSLFLEIDIFETVEMKTQEGK